MPAYTVTSTLTDPSGDLMDGDKYVVQVQSTTPAFFAVEAATFSTPPDDGYLIIGGITDPGLPSHLEYTYASTDFVRVWATDEQPARVIFHKIG